MDIEGDENPADGEDYPSFTVVHGIGNQLVIGKWRETARCLGGRGVLVNLSSGLHGKSFRRLHWVSQSASRSAKLASAAPGRAMVTR